MSAHIVIARKFRPKVFAEVVGQSHITNGLKNQIKENKIPQSIIFAGQRGLGKTTSARIFSKAINCIDPVDNCEPCNKCEICDLLNRQALVDIIEIDGASNRGINEVRVLRENALYSPLKAKYKVYIIDEAHMLTREAFNALLKILEEPPSNVVFIMATTEPDRLPITIRSRCQIHHFKEISPKDMEIRLKQIINSENRQMEDKALNYIIDFAKGSMRDAESILEKVLSSSTSDVTYDDITGLLGIFDNEIIACIFNSIYANDSNSIIDLFSRLRQEPTNYFLLYEMLIDHYHENICNKIRGKNIDTDADITLNDLLFDLKILLNIEDNLQKTSFKDILFETTVLHIISKGRIKDLVFLSDMLKELKKVNNSAIKPSAGEAPPLQSYPAPEEYTESKDQTSDPHNGSIISPKPDINPGGLFDAAMDKLQQKLPLFHSIICHIESKQEDDRLIFYPDNSLSSMEILRKTEHIKQFENILNSVYQRNITVEFITKPSAKNKNKQKSKNFQESNIIRDDPVIKNLLNTFKGEIETIE